MHRLVADFPCPVLLTRADSYSVASAVHDLTVKTRPDDTQKIRLIRDMIARHVNLDRILERIT
jgi:BioD-like phosphotransacetylase family protein